LITFKGVCKEKASMAAGNGMDLTMQALLNVTNLMYRGGAFTEQVGFGTNELWMEHSLITRSVPDSMKRGPRRKFIQS
jgi:hypothetical protein